MSWLPTSAALLAGLGLASFTGSVEPAVADAAGAACLPLVVDAGGTYSGCYRSTDPELPAVVITTSEVVRLVGATVEHAGEGIVAHVDRVRLTVVDSTVTALDPGTPEPVSQRAITAYRPKRVVVQHDRFVDGHGISLVSDGDTGTSALVIRARSSSTTT